MPEKEIWYSASTARAVASEVHALTLIMMPMLFYAFYALSGRLKGARVQCYVVYDG